MAAAVFVPVLLLRTRALSRRKEKKSNHKRLFVRFFLDFFLCCVHFNISYARAPFSFFLSFL